MAHMWMVLCPILISVLYASAENCLTAIIGETVLLPCSLNTEESLKTEDSAVEWTTSQGDIVHTFMNGGDYLKNQDPQFKGRTELFRSELSHGNFSLRLSNVSVTDEGEFVCKYSKNNKGNTIQSEQCLQIAGHYSVPVVHRPAVAIFKDSEVDFTCISAGGFPEPKVHWSVNKKPLQDSSRVNTRMSRDSRGLYNLTSVLTLKVTEDVSVTCTIDNERLREKKTSAEIQNLITTEKEQKQEHGGAWAIGGLVVVMVLLPALIAVIMWN